MRNCANSPSFECPGLAETHDRYIYFRHGESGLKKNFRSGGVISTGISPVEFGEPITLD
jgi:hypothetical protein